MKLTIFKRSMIFSTFFGSCLCIALIVASLGTTHWVDARAKRTASNESEGRISFGLFEGRKELNFGYGWRTQDFSVKLSAGGARYPARRWAWVGSAACLCAALAAAGGGGALAALASAARDRARRRPLLATNALVVVFTLAAISIWLTEFHLRLVNNVMSEEDLAQRWTSEGTAELGLSFWLVVAACIAGFANIVCVCVAGADARDLDSVAPALEEKLNGAIMLY